MWKISLALSHHGNLACTIRFVVAHILSPRRAPVSQRAFCIISTITTPNIFYLQTPRLSLSRGGKAYRVCFRTYVCVVCASYFVSIYPEDYIMYDGVWRIFVCVCVLVSVAVMCIWHGWRHHSSTYYSFLCCRRTWIACEPLSLEFRVRRH